MAVVASLPSSSSSSLHPIPSSPSVMFDASERAKSALATALVVALVVLVVLARQNDKVKGRRRRFEAAVAAAVPLLVRPSSRPMPNAAQTPPAIAAATNFAPRVTPLSAQDQFQRERSVLFSPVARSWADL